MPSSPTMHSSESTENNEQQLYCQCYRIAEIVHYATVIFCNRFINYRSIALEEMTQSARSAKQDIYKAQIASEMPVEITLAFLGVVDTNLTELKNSFAGFLDLNNLPVWPNNHSMCNRIKELSVDPNRSYHTYKSFINDESSETAANTLICLIHEAHDLITSQITHLKIQQQKI